MKEIENLKGKSKVKKLLLSIIVIVIILGYLFYIQTAFQSKADYGILYFPRTDQFFTLDYYRDFRVSTIKEIIFPFSEWSVRYDKPEYCFFVETLKNMDRDMNLPVTNTRRTYTSLEELKKDIQNKKSDKLYSNDLDIYYLNFGCNKNKPPLPTSLSFISKEFFNDISYVDVVFSPFNNKKSCKDILIEKDAILISWNAAQEIFQHYAKLKYLDELK